MSDPTAIEEAGFSPFESSPIKKDDTFSTNSSTRGDFEISLGLSSSGEESSVKSSERKSQVVIPQDVIRRKSSTRALEEKFSASVPATLGSTSRPTSMEQRLQQRMEKAQSAEKHTAVSTKQQRANKAIETALIKGISKNSNKEKRPSVSSRRNITMASPQRNSVNGWGSLTQKSSSLRHSAAPIPKLSPAPSKFEQPDASSKRPSSTKISIFRRVSETSSDKNAKENGESSDLAEQLKKQVDELQKEKNELKIAHNSEINSYEKILDETKQADEIFIQQLIQERNELQAKLRESEEHLQSMEEERSETSPVPNKESRVSNIEVVLQEDPSSSPDKLDRLQARRLSSESQLESLVMDSQNSPTDLQTVIVNLQDELAASKQVMHQQKEQVRQLIEIQTTGDLEAETGSRVEDGDWKGRFKNLQAQYSQLQNDRAWGEFQLRNRITLDSLKYHRRLMHWKNQVQELESRVESLRELEALQTAVPRLVRADIDSELSSEQSQGDPADPMPPKSPNTPGSRGLRGWMRAGS